MQLSLSYKVLASVPALSCRCMTYAYLNCYVSYVFYSYSYMPTLQSTMATCSLLWLPIVYYGYLQVVIVDCRQPQQTVGSHSRQQVAIVDYRQPKQTVGSHSRLQVAIVDCRQPQQIVGSHSRLQGRHVAIATCTLLWLPVYSTMVPVYTQSTLATCNLLLLPVVYYGYLQSAMATCTSCSLLLLCLQPPFSAAYSLLYTATTIPTCMAWSSL